jgi:predicted component of type VI protein secretion system
MQALLRVIQKQANVQQVRLLPETVIGRSVDCNLKIASTQVSRRHCRVVVNEAGVFIEDLCSANGTFLDGQRLLPNQLTLALPGAQLVIGPATFAVEYRSAKIPRPDLGASARSVTDTVREMAEETASFSVADTPVVPASPAPTESPFSELAADASESAITPEPVQEPPKRMRSLFGFFSKGAKVDAPSAPPFQPTDSLSDSNARIDETPSEAASGSDTTIGKQSTVVPDDFPANVINTPPEPDRSDEADNPFRQFSQY